MSDNVKQFKPRTPAPPPANDDAYFMKLALEQAAKAAEQGDVPVGAVVVCNGEVVAATCNEKELNKIPTCHAEMIAIERAALKLDRWRLTDCDLYVTLEPCLMCAGAIVQARLRRVVYGARDPKAGAVTSLYQTLADTRLNHRPEVIAGVLETECSEILKRFFALRR
jgi:tRNA(adenine34) deaminase